MRTVKKMEEKTIKILKGLGIGVVTVGLVGSLVSVSDKLGDSNDMNQKILNELNVVKMQKDTAIKAATKTTEDMVAVEKELSELEAIDKLVIEDLQNIVAELNQTNSKLKANITLEKQNAEDVEVIETVKEVSGIDVDVKHREAIIGEVNRSCLNSNKAIKNLNWKSDYNLKQGLELTYRWFKEEK